MISNLQKKLLVAGVMGAVLVGCAPEKPSEARLRGDLEHRGESAGEQRPTAEIESEAVVVVDGEEVTLGELNRRLEELPEFARARFSTTEQKQNYLESVTQFEVMADVAEQEGFGERAEVRYALEAALAERVVEQVISQKLSMNDIDDEAIERYYQSHRDEFQAREARRVALIRVDSREEAERLREQVLEAMEQASDSPINAFRREAAQHSVDRDAAKKGGDIGFVEPSPGKSSDDVTQIAQQVFALGEIGEVTPVFAVDGGFALATFFEERDASVVPLEEASGEIRAKLFEQRKRQIERELIAELRESASLGGQGGRQVERHDAAIEAAKGAPEQLPRRVEDIEVHEVAPFGGEPSEDEDADDKNAEDKNAEDKKQVSKP